MKTVLCFGSFDPLHEGHHNFFEQAVALGDRLLVVVARDAAIQGQKGYQSHQSEDERLQAVQAAPAITEARLGDTDPSSYRLLTELDFDVLALGYDQQPDDATVQAKLREVGKEGVTVVRLKPFEPDQHKSTIKRRKAEM